MADLIAAGGWCAPSAVEPHAYDVLALNPERWPAGLLAEDLEWLARMLFVAEIDPSGPLDLPGIRVRRGGIWYPDLTPDPRSLRTVAG